MTIVETLPLTVAQKEAIIKLWNNEYPKQLQHNSVASFDKYLNALTHKTNFLLLDDVEQLRGWAVSFQRNKERWFAIIIDKNLHGQGMGRFLLNRIKEKEKVLNGWVMDRNDSIKEDGSIYTSPLPFYIKNGFILYPEERLETETMSAVKIQWVK